MEAIYKNLLQIPLFNGVSFKKMLEIIGNIPFQLLKYSSGQKIVSAREPCESLYILYRGAVTVDYQTSDTTMRYSLAAPDILFANVMFGLTPRFPAEIHALTDTSIVTVSKNEYIKVLRSDEIFLYNLLNMLSAVSQRSYYILGSDTALRRENTLKAMAYVLTPSRATDIIVERRSDKKVDVYEARTRRMIQFDEEKIE